MKERHVSIWFMIGLQLTIYGVLIVGAGIYDWVNPAAPEAQVVLSNVHAGIWLGLVLFVLGLFYTVKFRPRPGA